MNIPDITEKTLTRKQFLALIGSVLGGLMLSRFLVSSHSYARANNYGNNTYGNKSLT